VGLRYENALEHLVGGRQGDSEKTSVLPWWDSQTVRLDSLGVREGQVTFGCKNSKKKKVIRWCSDLRGRKRCHKKKKKKNTGEGNALFSKRLAWSRFYLLGKESATKDRGGGEGIWQRQGGLWGGAGFRKKRVKTKRMKDTQLGENGEKD